MNIVFIRISALALLLLLLVFTSCGRFAAEDKRESGNQVILKVEAFRSSNGRLPNSLSEIGIAETEEGPIYYRRLSDERYELWYGTALGESSTYDSDRKTWQP